MRIGYARVSARDQDNPAVAAGWPPAEKVASAVAALNSHHGNILLF